MNLNANQSSLPPKRNIAIFASGTGSNARKLMEHFKDSAHGKVALVVSSKAGAGVLDIADEYGVPTLVLKKSTFVESPALLDDLAAHGVEVIVLAGFLWLVPGYLIEHYHDRIINIHPALLPKYGGKGMYGMNVHRAVHEAGEKETGITIHLANAHYDEGRVLFQATCEVLPGDSPEEIARKVLVLEHANFSRVVEDFLKTL